MLLKLWYKFLKKSPLDFPQVQYWKYKTTTSAKLMKHKDGHMVMGFEGEDELFTGFPRGHLLIADANGNYSAYTRLKHEIKNQIFNESWKLLEEGKSDAEVVNQIKDRLFGTIAQLANESKYDFPPPNKLIPAVKEIHRAWTKVAPPKTYPLRDYLCFILQEDDSYINRVQWLVKFFSWFRSPIKNFDYALQMLEHGEVIRDMKERQRLLRRILTLCLKDPIIKDLFIKFFKEVDWSKVKLTKAEKYHLRGKYFKCDWPEVEY